MDSFAGVLARDITFHGPSKVLVDKFHWHENQVGIVSSYTPDAEDVKDHFGVFRGVDQIESFGQTMLMVNVLVECRKMNCSLLQLRSTFSPVFISIGQVVFHDYLAEGETFICVGQIKFYKFRQQISDGRVYKVPKGLDLDDYFSGFTGERIRNYDLRPDFKLIAEFSDLTGRISRNK